MQSLVNEAEETKQMTVFNWYILQLQVSEAIRNCSQIPENTTYLKEDSHRNNKIFWLFQQCEKSSKQPYLLRLQNTICSTATIQKQPEPHCSDWKEAFWAESDRTKYGDKILSACTQESTKLASCLSLPKSRVFFRPIRDITQKWNLKRKHRWNTWHEAPGNRQITVENIVSTNTVRCLNLIHVPSSRPTMYIYLRCGPTRAMVSSFMRFQDHTTMHHIR